MFKAIARWIFLDKRGRAAAKTLRERRPPKPAEPDAAEPKPASERDILIEQAMSLYRQRRQEYERLDEDVQARLAKLARDKLDGKDS